MCNTRKKYQVIKYLKSKKVVWTNHSVINAFFLQNFKLELNGKSVYQFTVGIVNTKYCIILII